VKAATSILLGALMGLPVLACAADVATYHNGNTRQGSYVTPTLTQAAAANLQLDPNFTGTVSGNVHAQPLYWQPSGSSAGEIIVATETNQVYALDATTGATLWSVQLAPPEPNSALGCGDIDPEGITGTPVIDSKTGTLYLDALTAVNNAPTHTLYALSLANKGATLPGWPINVDAMVTAAGGHFNSKYQGERGAQLLLGGTLYVTYGGRDGDCGTYYGTVIGVNPATQALIGKWQTTASGGGIWAQGGVSSDGKALFVTTGNTFTNSSSPWSGGEAIIRLPESLAFAGKSADYFAPSNWQTLDDQDRDLGGTEAIPLNVDSATGKPAARVIAFGKDGNAYLANRNKLGGIGGQIGITHVSGSVIITAPAVYETPTTTMVAFTSYNGMAPCAGQNNLTMLDVAPKGTSPVSVAWCQDFSGRGSPIVTTTDGVSNPIVWVVGAEGDNLLHGFNATTGAVLFGGGGATMSGLNRFQTLIAANGRLYVAANNKVYSFIY
jgi:outer membrane protein assembly factor BamB